MRTPIFALSFTILMGAASAFAAPVPQDQQNTPPQGEHAQGRRQMDPQQRVNMMAKRLKLSDDQKQKLLPVLADQQQQMQSMRQDTSMSREDRMAKMKTIREQTDEKINGILNDDQKQKYAEMQQRMRDRMQQRMKDNAGSNGGGGSTNQ